MEYYLELFDIWEVVWNAFIAA